RRIILDVSARLELLFAIAHESVPIIFLPELTAPSQQPICFLRRVFFPTLQDLRHRRSAHLEQCVNVVWHHHPGPQIITLAVKEPHCALHNLSNLRSAQMTLTTSTVEIRLQFRATLPVILNHPEMLPFGTK